MSQKSRDWVRRGVGILFLLAALGMVVLGLTDWGKRLEGKQFLEYWMLCWAFTIVAMIFALWDLRITRARTRAAKMELIENAVKNLEEDVKKPGPNGPSQ